MFGDDKWAASVAEDLLSSFELDELLELNDLTEHEALSILIEAGFIVQPERYFQYEEETT